jgi:hypothetical protein
VQFVGLCREVMDVMCLALSGAHGLDAKDRARRLTNDRVRIRANAAEGFSCVFSPNDNQIHAVMQGSATHYRSHAARLQANVETGSCHPLQYIQALLAPFQQEPATFRLTRIGGPTVGRRGCTEQPELCPVHARKFHRIADEAGALWRKLDSAQNAVAIRMF